MRTQSAPVPAPTPWRPPKEICSIPGRLLVVSHSLPLHNVHNRWRWRQPLEDSKSRLPAPLRLEGGLWIGWSGPAEEDHGAEGIVATPVDSNGDLRDVTTVLLDRLSDYDPGPAMQTLWPVLHGLPEAYDFDSSFWPAFERLNDKVARLLGSLYQPDDRILVTPIRDACCRTAREFCAARDDGEGALVMSELCEETRQVGDAALCVNPLDEDALTETLERALDLSRDERIERMSCLRSRLLNGSAQGSTRRFLDLLAASDSIVQA